MELSLEGNRVFVGTGGAPVAAGRPAIVFVHGAGMDHSVWALQSRYFAHHGYSVLAPDLPGHGRSKGSPLDSVEAMGRWVVALLDAAGLARAAFVGHSMGAVVALEAAAQAPERVARLALLGAALGFPVNPALLDAARESGDRAARLMASWGHDRGYQIGGHHIPGLWMLGGSMRLIASMAPGVLHADLVAVGNYQRGPEAAQGVRAPCLVVVGGRDLMTPPKAGRALAQAIAGARLEIIEDAGHMMMLERPEKTVGMLKSFLELARA